RRMTAAGACRWRRPTRRGNLFEKRRKAGQRTRIGYASLHLLRPRRTVNSAAGLGDLLCCGNRLGARPQGPRYRSAYLRQLRRRNVALRRSPQLLIGVALLRGARACGATRRSTHLSTVLRVLWKTMMARAPAATWYPEVYLWSGGKLPSSNFVTEEENAARNCVGGASGV